jgi:hypothetical protein
MNKARIKEEAEHFFEWPDPARRDHVTLTSCLIFAEVIAGMAVDAEREECAKLCEEHWKHGSASMPMQDTVADDMDEVAKQYAHKLAMNLECLVLECPPSARFFDEANTTLGEYRSAMNAIHERECPTHMGEPVVR